MLIVDVKPAERLGAEEVEGALSWAGRVFTARGWEHEVWGGADPQRLANVRFLTGYRRTALVGAPTGIDVIAQFGHRPHDCQRGGGA